MQRFARWLGFALLAPVHAQGHSVDDYGSIDAFLIPAANLELRAPSSGPVDQDARGIGFRMLTWLVEPVVFTGEWSRARLEESNEDLDELRAGIGFAGPSTSGLFFEYHLTEVLGERDDAYAVRARASDRFGAALTVYGDAAYVRSRSAGEDFDGTEFTLGAAYDLHDFWGTFLDYRVSDLEGRESETERDVWQLRIGVRLLFDC